MKIVHVVLALNTGGMECMLVDILRKQALTANVSLVIVNDTYDQVLLDSIKDAASCILIKRPSGSRNPWHLLRLLQTLRRLGPDILHLHQLSLVCLVRMLPFPRITTVHETLSRAAASIAAREHLCGISAAVGETIRQTYPQANCAIVTNGIDFSRITPREALPDGPFRLLQVSRLYHPHKGQDVLLRALAVLRDSHGECNFTVTFVGEGSSQNYLTTLARGLGLEKQCEFLGKKPREWVYRNLSRYDLLVQPSRCEGFGLTIVEAMAARVPVLVADLAAPMEVIQGGRFGHHFACGDAGDCATRIRQVLPQLREPGYASHLDAAYDYARTHFEVSHTVDRYYTEYEAAIGTCEFQSRRFQA